jgi:glycosyltransferase involved in cell wall biosynthesis
LGLLGRLNRFTAGEDLVHVIPCASDVGPGGPAGESVPPVKLPDDAFVVLWSGGFNTWCDVPTLAEGVREAMAVEPRLYLVVTGGAIAGHDEESWEEWTETVEQSPFADRLLLLGNLTPAELGFRTARADVGLLTEKPLVERELGSSGRIAAWLEAGLPFVATAQSELARTCIERGAAFGYETGNAADLAEVLVSLAGDPDGLREAGRRARETAALFNSERTTDSLRRWVGRPRRASDLGAGAENPLSYWALAGAFAKVSGDRERLLRERAHLEAEVDQAKSELHTIRISTMWRTWAVLRRVKAILTYPWRKIRGRTGG